MDDKTRTKALRERLEELHADCFQKSMAAFATGSPTEIFPHLYLGSADHASNVDLLTELGITAVVNMAESDVPTRAASYPDTWAYLGYAADDESWYDIMRHFDEVHAFIDRACAAGRKVLVHCSKGVSRSATMVLAYAMLHRGWALEDSLRHVATRRPIVQPNPGFVRQLIAFHFARAAAAVT